MILAPLRGVTVRCFRRIFAGVIAEVGFTEIVTPFVSAAPGVDPLSDRELRGGSSADPVGLRVTPQFIGKDPDSFAFCLTRIREAGYETADLNCGCPFPMVRRKGRGSGLLRSPDTLRRMLEAGCTVMGEGRLSVKARLGVDRPDELIELMPLLNEFPLRFLTVHARTARQMYEGAVDMKALEAIRAVARMPVVANGDIDWHSGEGMVGRSFIKSLGDRDDIGKLLLRYIDASSEELCGERPVLGRIKELVSYWRGLPRWSRRWGLVKICASLAELRATIGQIDSAY